MSIKKYSLNINYGRYLGHPYHIKSYFGELLGRKVSWW